MPAVKLHQGLVAAFISVVDDADRLRSDRVTDAVEPGDEDETAGYPLALHRHLASTAPREHNGNILLLPPEGQAKLFFEFRENASWNDKRDCVEFSLILGPYEGTVRVPRRVFQGLLDQRPTPERCIEAFHLQRTRFEMIAERKLRRRQLTDNGNVEITGRDLREKTPPVGQGSLFERATAG